MTSVPECDTSSECKAKAFLAEQLAVEPSELNLDENIATLVRDPIEAVQAAFELRQWLQKIGGDARITNAQLAAQLLGDRITAEEFVHLCTARENINLESVWRDICRSNIKLREVLAVIVKQMPKPDKRGAEADACVVVGVAEKA